MAAFFDALGRFLTRAWLILSDTLRHPLTPSVLVEDERGIRIDPDPGHPRPDAPGEDDRD